MSREYVTMAEVAEKQKLANLTPEIDLTQIKLYHRNINRPQLFLAGFYDYFDNERLQLLGRAESEYLKQFPAEVRREKFDKFFSTKKYGVPVLYTAQVTASVMVNIIGWINELLAPSMTVYGVLVDVYGEGILITGDSGVGKSETALELIKRGHRLVADDLVEISRIGDTLLFGQAPDLTRHFIELRGIGVVDVKSLYGIESVRDRATVDMLINLEEWDPNKVYDRLGLKEEYEDVLGVQVVKHTVPIRTGRNLAIIVEAAAINYRVKKMGYNAAQNLVSRVFPGTPLE